MGRDCLTDVYTSARATDATAHAATAMDVNADAAIFASVFCGGSLDIPKESRDQEALYFKLPEGKKAIGDSAYKNIPEKVTTFAKNKEAKDFINRAKARQESYHARLMQQMLMKAQSRSTQEF